MNEPAPVPEIFWPLLNAACDGALSNDQMQELDAILASNIEARKLFADHFQLQTDIRFLGRVAKIRDIGLAEIRSTFVEPPVPPASSPGFGFLATAFQNTIGFFSQEVPFSLLIATIITATGLWMGSLVYVSRPEPLVARKSSPAHASPPAHTTAAATVGWITGSVDCKWEARSRGKALGSAVALGDKLALASGLLEISYNTGAKVILQGPAIYEAESPDGGFLSVGKLTAKLEKQEERRGESQEKPSAASPQPSAVSRQPSGKVASGQWSVASESDPKFRNPEIPKSPISNPQFLIPNPLLPPAPMFAVRTPTATVTDLGTEFAVEVSKEGMTTSHVFQGSVRFQALSTVGKPADEGYVLKANQSARVEKQSAQSNDKKVVVFATPVALTGFVREILRPAVKPLEQVVVVAHWKFDGDQFLADSSGHGHTLVNRGAKQSHDTALFDGKAIMNTVDSIDLRPYSKVRVSWSQKIDDPTYDQLMWEHTTDYNGNPGAIASAIWDPANRKGIAMAGLRTRMPADPVTGNCYNIDTFDVLPNVWESFTVEFRRLPDRKNQTLYRTDIVKVFKDGAQVGSGSSFEDHQPPETFLNAPFFIGARDGLVSPLHGQIDNLKIEGIIRLEDTNAKAADNNKSPKP